MLIHCLLWAPWAPSLRQYIHAFLHSSNLNQFADDAVGEVIRSNREQESAFSIQSIKLPEHIDISIYPSCLKAWRSYMIDLITASRGNGDTIGYP